MTLVTVSPKTFLVIQHQKPLSFNSMVNLKFIKINTQDCCRGQVSSGQQGAEEILLVISQNY